MRYIYFINRFWIIPGLLIFLIPLLLLAKPVKPGQANLNKEYQQLKQLYSQIIKAKDKEPIKKFRELDKKLVDLSRRARQKGNFETKCKSLFTAANLVYKTYQIHGEAIDLKNALDLYSQVANHCEKHYLNDDALYIKARIYRDDLHNLTFSKLELETLLKGSPGGDMAERAKKDLVEMINRSPQPIKLTPRSVSSPAIPKKKPEKEPEKSLSNKVNTQPLTIIWKKIDNGLKVEITTNCPINYQLGEVPPDSKRKLPWRIFFDLPGHKLPGKARKLISVNQKSLRQIRAAMFKSNVTRVVLDIAQSDCYQIKKENHRVAISLWNPGSGPIGCRSLKMKTHAKIPDKPPLTKNDSHKRNLAIKTPKDIKKIKKNQKPSYTDRNKTFRVKKVVIDPGHGGEDPGAIGVGGLFEKDVTLRLAKLLYTSLKKMDLQVKLTRTKDQYISLEDRTAIANKWGADLFISLHVNSFTNHKTRGFETYYLNITDDRYAIKLAARENFSSEKEMDDLQFILADLALKSNVKDSIRLATLVQKSMVGGLRFKYMRIKDHGVKHALFYVLLGANMPAILVETGFISNPQEERLLSSRTFLKRMANSITKGIINYIKDLSVSYNYHKKSR